MLIKLLIAPAGLDMLLATSLTILFTGVMPFDTSITIFDVTLFRAWLVIQLASVAAAKLQFSLLFVKSNTSLVRDLIPLIKFLLS